MTASSEKPPRLAAMPCAPNAVVNPAAYSGHIAFLEAAGAPCAALCVSGGNGRDGRNR